MKFSNIVAVFILTIFFYACTVEEIDTMKTKHIRIDPPVSNVYSSITGTVTDIYGEAVEDAQIITFDANVRSDQFGIYNFIADQYNEYGQFLTFRKNGYFDGYKFATPSLNAIEYTPVVLLPKNEIANFNSEKDYQLEIDQHISIQFQNESLVKESGDIYTGEVLAYGFSYALNKMDELASLPGDYRGVDINGVIIQKSSYSMFTLELEGSHGEKLQLKDGAIAELKISPEMLQDQLPESLTLFSLDEENGHWIEEEVVSLSNNNEYTTQLSHFSSWSIGSSYSAVQIEGIVTDQSNQTVAQANIWVTNSDNHLVAFFISDSEGKFNGSVPQDESLSLNISNVCDFENIFSIPFGPLTADTNLGELEVDLILTAHFIGSLIDCDQEPISSGYILIQSNNRYYHVFGNSSGAFDNQVLLCNSDSITITAFDYENLKMSEPIQVSTSQSNFNLGLINVCEDLEEYFTYTVQSSSDSNNYFTDQINIQNLGGIDEFIITSKELSTNDSNLFTFTASTTGATIAEYITSFQTETEDLFLCLPCGDLNIHISHYADAINEFMVGTFSGKIINNDQEEFNVSGSFKVLREF